MDDDSEPVGDGGDTILYDYLKHLTSLCLFSLAGVAALADKIHGRSAASVIIALVVIGMAAFSSFLATGMIVEARFGRKPLRGNINLFRHAAPLLLSVGVGMFLFLFVQSLKP